MADFVDQFLVSHDRRIAELRSMPERTVSRIWHPFMQHSERSKEGLTVMDSAHDDFFQTPAWPHGPSLVVECGPVDMVVSFLWFYTEYRPNNEANLQTYCVPGDQLCSTFCHHHL